MVRMPLPNRLRSFQTSSTSSSSITNSNNSNNASDVLSKSSPHSRSASPGSDKNTSTTSTNNRQGGPMTSLQHVTSHVPLMLRIKAIRARNLAPKDKDGFSDPYLVLVLGDSRQSTVTIPKTLDPEWNEIIDMPINSPHSLLLEVTCWDKDRFGKDYMGEFDVQLEEVFASGIVTHEPTWYHLESRKTGRKKSRVTGEVLLEFSLHDPTNPSATAQQVQQKLSSVISSSADLQEDIDAMLARTDSGDASADEDEDELKGTESEGATTPKDDVSTRRKRKLKMAQLKKKAKQEAYEFIGLSDLAGVLFLEISRITDLPPERNMTRTSFDMDPFVVSSLGKKTYRTKIIRHNLNPVYDEKLVFQVMRHETNYTLNFTVIDRDKLSGNDFIGSASLPLEQVTASAPDPDPDTGLYPYREPGAPSLGPESRKSRFRLPLSRSSSSNNVSKLPLRGQAAAAPAAAPAGQTLTPQSSLNSASGSAHSHPSSLPPSSAAASTFLDTPSSSITQSQPTLDHLAPEDPDLKPFELPVVLKNKDRWDEKCHPILYLKAKYLPYKALRQQFWRAMLRQYDADESGYLNKIELTTMLDTLGSTLHESTIDGFFKRFGGDQQSGEPGLSFDHAVMCLEDLLQQFQEQRKDKSWRQKLAGPHPFSGPPSPDVSSDAVGSESDSQQVKDTKPKTIHVEHLGSRGEEGEHLDSNDLAEGREEERVVKIYECPICHQPRLSKRSDADIITHIATCASQDWRQVNSLVMGGFVTASQAQRKWYSKVITKIGYGGYKLGANSANILVQDRITGQISEERMSVYVRLGIRLLYKGLKSREMEKKRIRKLLRSMSFKQGRKFDDPASVSQIHSFINFHRLDMSEVLLPVSQFKNFNEFFYRKLKADARPCSAPDRPQIVTSPADCRSVVFNKIHDAQAIWVKGREFTVERLLGNAYPEDAKRYAHGSALGVFRLAPQDYHRFHIPVDGVLGEPKTIEGEYYTVNPMAIRSALDVYGENVRVIVPIESEVHGRVIVVCVGAMMVGSTVITRKPGERVSRAEELGYFKFGGSTILLLFEPGMVEFDSDLHDNSNDALETLAEETLERAKLSCELNMQIRVGMSIGHSPDHAPHTPDMQKDHPAISEKQDAHRRIQGGDIHDMNGSGLGDFANLSLATKIS